MSISPFRVLQASVSNIASFTFALKYSLDAYYVFVHVGSITHLETGHFYLTHIRNISSV